MKTVLLLRHAKSDWGQPDLADFDRPLNQRGFKDASLIGQILAGAECVPDKIIASPAKRAKQTAELVAGACGYKKSIQWAERFYDGHSNDMLAALQSLSDTVQRPLLVGHNPTMEETASALLVGESKDWGSRLVIRMPTAALLCLDLAIESWPNLQPGQAQLRWFVIPKLVKDF
jgi:phosphohistidine phosphatase